MSGKSPTKTENQEKKSYGALTWVNLYLDPNQKQAADLFCADPDRVMDMVSDMLVAGYSITYAFSDQTQSFTCTLIGKRTGTDNDGCGMTSHAGSPQSALWRCIYKAYVLCEGGVWLDYAERYSTPLT